MNRTGESGGLDVDCNGNGFELDVREALAAPLLREALKEALDEWYQLVGMEPAFDDDGRIAELRAKFLGVK